MSDQNSIIIERLLKLDKKITFAESCTGGLIASEFTKNSGVSSVFNGSIISYSNEIKEKVLNVQKDTLIKYGAVSKEVVEQMLSGVMRLMESDYAIAVSGVAGPTGGTEQKPVGTVVIGVGSKNSTIINQLHFKGNRVSIQQQSQKYAMSLFLENFL